MNEHQTRKNSLKHWLRVAGVLFVTGLLTKGLVGCGGNNMTVTAPSPSPSPSPTPAPSAAITITSIDKTMADSFTPLTITGTGFNPTNQGISVVFIPQSGNAPIFISVSAAGSTTLQAMVPTLFDPITQSFTSGTVDVQVVQFSESTVSVSNRITGLQINALPPVPPGVPTGAMTTAFLSSALDVSASSQAIAAGNPNLSVLAGAMAQYDSDLRALVPAINKITNDSTQTVALTTSNGGTAPLNAKELVLADQLVQAMVASLVNQGQVSTLAAERREERTNFTQASPSASCPPSANSPTFDSQVCALRNLFNNLTAGDPTVVQKEKEALANIFLGGLGVWGVSAALSGGVGVVVIVPAELTWMILSPYMASYFATGSLPSRADVAGGLGPTVLDVLAEKPVGGSIFAPASDMFKVLKAAADAAPPPGTLITSGWAVPIAGGGTALIFPDGTQFVKVPAQQEVVDTTQLVLAPQSTFTLKIATGTGMGTAAPFPAGVSCGAGCRVLPAETTVKVSAMPGLGFQLQNWSGDCSSNGDCVIVMDSNKIVTANFEPIPPTSFTLSGSFKATVIDHGNGGCPGSATINGPATVTVKSAASGFDYSGTVTLAQGSGICDNYSGTYNFSGSVPTLNGGTVSATSGIVTIIGAFNGKVFSGAWGFSASIGPDVADAPFTLQ